MAGFKLNRDEQKRLILDCLHQQPMTVEALAKRMLCSGDKIRKRLHELKEETKMVRVMAWDVKGTNMVRVWGVGAKREHSAAPLPLSAEKRQVIQANRRAFGRRIAESGACKASGRKKEKCPVPYRLEALDKWIFTIKGAK